MPRTKTMPAADAPAMQQLTFGTLTRVVPRAIIATTLEELHRENVYDCKLPALLMVYHAIALNLQRRCSAREVLRWLLHGLRRQWKAVSLPRTVATAGAISVARARLGWEVLCTLFTRCARPLATPRTRGAWYRGLRLLAVDGTVLATPDTASNRAAFGKSGSKHGQSAFPLARVTLLVEVGTHAIIGAELGGWRHSETGLAQPLLAKLATGMLLLADRIYFSRARWCAAVAHRAQLLWRVPLGVKLPCEELLPDGTYRTTVYPTNRDRRLGTNGVPARVIEYTLPGVPEAEPVYRLVTTLLEAPAEELAALYHERWEAEGTLDEVKTHLRGGDQMLLRSLTADGVRQEIYGLLLAHYVVRAVMHDAALQADEDPDDISFTHTVQVLRRAVPDGAALPPSAVAGWYRRVLSEVLEERVESSRGTQRPHGVRRKSSQHPKRKGGGCPRVKRDTTPVILHRAREEVTGG